MIDIHCHILPDLDDGPATLEDALSMIEIARDDGITTMVATPHFLNGVFDVSVEAARERHELMVREVAERGIGVEILLGSEVHLDVDILHAVQNGGFIPLGDPGRALLLELPTTSMPTGTEEVIFEIQTAGYVVVLAHPERIDEFSGDVAKIERMRDRGVLTQVTARSITGGFGMRAKRVARKWLKRGLVDIIATDAHRPRGRPPILSEAVEWVTKKLGEEAAHDMVVRNPARVLGRSTEAT
jgi:protein-tyrosine phosphatase